MGPKMVDLKAQVGMSEPPAITPHVLVRRGPSMVVHAVHAMPAAKLLGFAADVTPAKLIIAGGVPATTMLRLRRCENPSLSRCLKKFCWSSAHAHSKEFLFSSQAIAKDLKENFAVDETKMFVTGCSNGGMMTQYIVGAVPDLFMAAIPNYALPLEVRIAVFFLWDISSRGLTRCTFV